MAHATTQYYWIDKTDKRYLHTFTPGDFQYAWERFRYGEHDDRMPVIPEDDETIVNPKFARFCAGEALIEYLCGLDLNERLSSIRPQFKPRGRGITAPSRSLGCDTVVLVWPGLVSDPPNTYQFMGFVTDIGFRVLSREMEGGHGNYYEMDEGQILHMKDLK